MADNETTPAAKKTAARKRTAAAAQVAVPGSDQEVTAAPAKKTTRTRKKAPAAPAQVTPSEGQAGAELASGATAEVAGTAASEAAAPAKKATRSRKKAAAAPVEAAPVAGDPGGASNPDGADSAVAAPVKRTTRKRAAAAPKATEAAPAGTGGADPGADSASAPPEAGEQPAAKKTTARKRTTKAAAAPEPAAAQSDSEEQIPPAPAKRSRRASKATSAPEAAATPQSPGASADAAPAPQTDGGAGKVSKAATGPRLATTALLFQAPSTTPAPVGTSSPEQNAAGAVGEPQAAAVPATKATRKGAQGGKKQQEGKKHQGGKQQPEPEAAPADETATAVAAQDAAPDGAGEATGDDTVEESSRRRRRGGRGRRGKGGTKQDDTTTAPAEAKETPQAPQEVASSGDDSDGSSTRRRRRRRGARGDEGDDLQVVSEVTALKGSTRLEAKRQRRREGRDAGRRRTVITEAEFLARRESVERSMVVREIDGRTQIAVLEDGVLVEHYVSRRTQVSMAGNVYLGRVQNVLPSMEAAFVDVGKGRNAVLYAGEVNWDAAGLDGGQPRRIEQALTTGDSILVQVTKDPIGHKGARLTSQITLAGRYLVYVPGGGMTGISRKLPEPERNRLKKLLKQIVPEGGGVIVRTAAEGASEEELRADIERLTHQWDRIEAKSKSGHAPVLLQGEPELALRVVRDIFNEDFSALVVSGDEAWETISQYIADVAPDLQPKLTKWTGEQDVFAAGRVDEQLAKGMDRKVWLPSGGSLVIDRTEAMTVIDVNTGKFTGAGGTLEETVTKNNLEAAEEIVRQLRLRDIGGIIVIDFIDMVLESNRDLVLRRLVECLSRDRTRHQVAEVTSLGLVQMTRKRVGQGLVEAFSETCEACGGRGFILHDEPVERGNSGAGEATQPAARRKKAPRTPVAPAPAVVVPVLPEASSKQREEVKATLATIAAAAAHHHDETHTPDAPKPSTGRGSGSRRAQRPAVEIEVVGDTEPAAEIDVMALIRAEKHQPELETPPAPAVVEEAAAGAAEQAPAADEPLVATSAREALAELAAGIPAAAPGTSADQPASGRRRHRRAQG